MDGDRGNLDTPVGSCAVTGLVIALIAVSLFVCIYDGRGGGYSG